MQQQQQRENDNNNENEIKRPGYVITGLKTFQNLNLMLKKFFLSMMYLQKNCF